jgi:hypothetical protein
MSSRTMSGRPNTFGIQEKQLNFRIVAGPLSAPSWTTPVVIGGPGENSGNAAVGIARGVASVAQTAAGKFTVTLEDTYAKLTGIQATFSCSGDAVDIYAQGGAMTNLASTTPVTLVVKTKTGAVNTNPATTDLDTYISVSVTFEDSD